MNSLLLLLPSGAVADAVATRAGGLYSVPAGAMMFARRPAGRCEGTEWLWLRKGELAGTSTIDFGDEARAVFGLRMGRSTI